MGKSYNFVMRKYEILSTLCKHWPHGSVKKQITVILNPGCYKKKVLIFIVIITHAFLSEGLVEINAVYY